MLFKKISTYTILCQKLVFIGCFGYFLYVSDKSYILYVRADVPFRIVYVFFCTRTSAAEYSSK